MSKRINTNIRKKLACTLVTTMVVGSSCGLASADNGFDKANKSIVGYVSMVGEVGVKGNAGFISTGEGDAGGKSYGISQFTSKAGGASANGFVKWLKKNYPQMGNNFNGVGRAGSSSFDSAWKKTYNENKDDFAKAQMEYTGMNYVDPFVAKAKSEFGVDFKSTRALLELAYSTTVQFGVNGTMQICRNAGINSNMSEAEILESATNEKIKSVGTYKFLGCNQNVRSGVKKRFSRELKEFKDIVEGTANIEGLGAIKLDDLVNGNANNIKPSLDDLVNGDTDNTDTSLDDLVNGDNNNTDSPLDDLVNGDNNNTDSPLDDLVNGDTDNTDSPLDDLVNGDINEDTTTEENPTIGENLEDTNSDGNTDNNTDTSLDDLVNEDTSTDDNKEPVINNDIDDSNDKGTTDIEPSLDDLVNGDNVDNDNTSDDNKADNSDESSNEETTDESITNAPTNNEPSKEDNKTNKPSLDDLVNSDVENDDKTEDTLSNDENSNSKNKDTSETDNSDDNKSDNTDKNNNKSNDTKEDDKQDKSENTDTVEPTIEAENISTLEQKLENNMFGKLFKITKEIMENENGVDGVKAMYNLV